jgi:hypothetical protein
MGALYLSRDGVVPQSDCGANRRLSFTRILRNVSVDDARITKSPAVPLEQNLMSAMLRLTALNGEQYHGGGVMRVSVRASCPAVSGFFAW